MNQRRWGLTIVGIKSSLEIMCFRVAPERVKCIGWTDRVRKGIRNHWCSCMEGARTDSKVSARDLQEVRRKRWPENTWWTVRSKKTSDIRWNFIMCGLESERSTTCGVLRGWIRPKLSYKFSMTVQDICSRSQCWCCRLLCLSWIQYRCSEMEQGTYLQEERTEYYAAVSILKYMCKLN